MKIRSNVSLKSFSTLQVGGKAKYFVEVFSKEDAVEAIGFARKKDVGFCVIGKGSNLLINEVGFNGLVICNRIRSLNFSDLEVFVGCGYSLPKLATDCMKRNLSNLEFGIGIPASVGGAIYMNASSYGQSIANSLISCEFLTLEGDIIEYNKKDLDFSYRKSSFQEMRGIILSAKFSLQESKTARQLFKEILQKKTKMQPLDEKSLGCVFKNGQDYSAGALIEKCGLKGLKIGGMVVSDVHANFIINKGGNAKDFLELKDLVKQKVYEKTKILLEEEVRFLDYE